MPKKTTEVIVDGKNDYVIGVKKNQPTLYRQIEEAMGEKSNHSSSYIHTETNRGSTELRHVTVSDSTAHISEKWKGLQQAVAVDRIVATGKKRTEERVYFISSRKGNALMYYEGVRAHWAIESMHYVKDVTLGEDASKIAKGNAPGNMSTLRNIGLNIFRLNEYGSIAQAIRLVANDIHTLYDLII